MGDSSSLSFLGRVRRLFGVVFGDFHYSPPKWLSGVGGKLAAGAKSHPKASGGIIVACAVLLIAGWYGYQWWDTHRARPVERTVMRTIDVAVSGASAASVNAESGDVAFSPLVMTFSESAAPIDLVGKEVERGIAIEPEVEGSWKWADDKNLVFTPKEEWPAGVELAISANPSVFPEEVKFESYKWKTKTPALSFVISDDKFYTDPTDPTRHQVVATVTSNYKVSDEAFDRALLFDIVGESDFFTYKGVKPDKVYQVVRDEKMGGYRFYVSSSRIAIPEQSDVLKVTLASKVMRR